LPIQGHRVFRGAWWSVNFLLVVALLSVIYSGGWEFSVRRYLDGFSDAIVPASEPAERQVEAILDWMRKGPSRLVAANPSGLPARDPQATLNYEQLLSVCGTATNAFLNLAYSNELTACALLCFLLFRFSLGWYADQLKMPRFRLRTQFLRAGTTFLRVPEIK
jgi:hypothetical protein